ncbi:MAG: hypothetical protein M3348_06495, partial [Acidobacteriota bacterium]|nr:hypothetical protein [Acidobacteriota bacterium]
MSADRGKAGGKAAGNRGKKTGSIFKQVERDPVTNKITRTYYVVRKRYARDGRVLEKKRTAATWADALAKKREIEDEIRAELTAPKEPARVHTFAELADHYEREYVVPAVFSGDEKVGGFLQPLHNIRRQLKVLRDAFGPKPLTEITYDDLRRFKERRLREPVVNRRTDKRTGAVTETRRARGVASVNHDLKRARRLFAVAVRLGWLAVNPFQRGEPLVSEAAEPKRERIIDYAEEERLLAECVGVRAHLRFPVVFAVETAARPGELRRARGRDWNEAEGVVRLVSYKGRRRRERLVPVTKRLREELE